MPSHTFVARQEALRPQAVALRATGASIGDVAARLDVPYHVAWRWTSEQRGTQARAGRPASGRRERARSTAYVATEARRARYFELVREMAGDGWSHALIARDLGLPRPTVSRWIAEIAR